MCSCWTGFSQYVVLMSYKLAPSGRYSPVPNLCLLFLRYRWTDQSACEISALITRTRVGAQLTNVTVSQQVSLGICPNFEAIIPGFCYKKPEHAYIVYLSFKNAYTSYLPSSVHGCIYGKPCKPSTTACIPYPCITLRWHVCCRPLHWHVVLRIPPLGQRLMRT